MSRTRLILVPAVAGEAAPWLSIDAAGHVLERGHASLETPLTGPAMRTVALVPGADVGIRWIEAVPGSLVQRRAAALWSLKDDLAAAPEKTRLAVGRVEDGQACVAVVGAAILSAWIDWLDLIGVRADAMIPDSLALRQPDADEVLTAVSFGPTIALRGRGFAASVDPDLAEAIAGPRRLIPLNDAGETEAMLIEAALNPPVVDLLDALDETRTEGWRAWRLAAGLAAALVLSPVIIDAAVAIRDDAAARDMNRQARTLAVRAWPDLADRTDATTEGARRAGALPGGGAVTAAAALYAAVEGVETAEMDSFSVDPEAGVRATVSYASWQDLDAMKASVAATGLSLTDTSTLDENGRIVSDVVVGAGQ